MFLQRTLGRIVDILLAFLIKQLFHSRFYFFLTVGYKMISTANSALRRRFIRAALIRRKPKEGDSKTIVVRIRVKSTKELTLVPEVFLDFSSRKRSRGSREAATTSRESAEEREKNLWLPWPRISLSCRRHLSNASNC